MNWLRRLLYSSPDSEDFPRAGPEKKDFVFVSGIGCSSRFPYYMNTYGFHTIHGRPMLFGRDRTKGIYMDRACPKVIDLADGKYSVDNVLVHDKTDRMQALILSEMTYRPEFPVPLGVIYEVEKNTYEDLTYQQIDHAIEKEGPGDLDAILHAGHTWEVK